MRRAVKATFTAVALTLGLMPLMGGPAAAVTTAVDATPETANNRTAAFQANAADNTHTITGTKTNDTGGASPIVADITAGPNADVTPVCTAPTPTTFSCTYANGTTGTTPKTGTDTIRVFADVTANGAHETAEPFDDVSKTFSGNPFAVAMVPETDSATTSTCNAFTVTVTDEGGNRVAAGTTVDVVVAQTSSPAATATSDVRFCDPTKDGGAGGPNSQATPTDQAPAAGTATGAGGTRRGEFTTDDNGQLTFGIVSDQTGTFSVRSFVENVDNDTFATGEPTDTSTKTFTAPTTTTTTPPGGGGPGASGEQGYALVAADGGIFNFGTSKFFGSTGALKLNQPVVGMDHTPTTKGYWLVAADGGIFAFGDATFYGSTGAMRLNRPIVGMRSTPTGNGYWLVASDGGIFAFGDAKFFGSTGATRLNQPVVGMSRTNSGQGYHLVASDGGIFAFGDAVFRGSTGAIRLNSPIDDITPTSSGGGYWLCARDGGVFAFGNARFLGSMGATRLNQPVVGCDAPLAQGGVAT